MPRGMSDDVSNVIVQALNRGLSRSQISGVVGVSRRAITRINTNLKKHGSPKAPPKGVKLGRPTKLTKSQAEAMVQWMAERNNSFYIKDLVKFLREGYAYRGCDGTVRRCLVRAGYRRKLPWHKSEITTWIPPDHEPVFSTIDDPRPWTVTSGDGIVENDPDAEYQTHADEAESLRPDIDPSLQTSSPSTHDSQAPQTQIPQQPLPDLYTLNTASHHLHPAIIPPSPYDNPRIGPQHNHDISTTLDPQLSDRSPAAAGNDSPDTTAEKDIQTTHTPPQMQVPLNDQISELQAKLARQEALILSLQQQLAQQAR